MIMAPLPMSIAASASMTLLEILGARPSDGSSTRNTVGSLMNARPSETMRRSPPESVPTLCLSSGASGGKICRIRSRRFLRSRQALPQ